MADSILGSVYSRADALKRQLYDMLTNPLDYASMMAGRTQEAAQAAQALQNMAFANPERPTQITDPKALQQLTDMIMAGPLGFAPAGITKPIPQYGLMHRPMAEEGGAARLHEAYKSFGEDIYGPNALQYFGSGDPREAGIVKLLKMIKDNPDKEVTIYRGVSKDAPKTINPGDWVTLDKSVAADYGDVISKKVKAKDVTTWPDALLEFGYFPK